MILTDQVVKMANGELPWPVGEVSDNTNEYSMFNDGSTEVEVSEFLYGLVRLIKPKTILTTGVYHGVSDLYIAMALRDNKAGYDCGISAIEIQQEYINRATRLWEAVGVDRYITPFLSSSLDLATNVAVFDLVFLDTEPAIRFAEFLRFYPQLSPGGFIVIHDLHRHLGQVGFIPGQEANWPYGPLPEEMKVLMLEDKVRHVGFGTPRGLALFYKVHEGDWHE